MVVVDDDDDDDDVDVTGMSCISSRKITSCGLVSRPPSMAVVQCLIEVVFVEIEKSSPTSENQNTVWLATDSSRAVSPLDNFLRIFSSLSFITDTISRLDAPIFWYSP